MGEDVSALRRLEARHATVSDSVYSARSDAGGHKPCSASLGRTPHRSRDVSGLDSPSQKPARVRFSRLASQKCGRAAFQSWCQPAKANTLLGRRRPASRSPYPGETQLTASGPKKTVAPGGAALSCLQDQSANVSVKMQLQGREESMSCHGNRMQRCHKLYGKRVLLTAANRWPLLQFVF